MISLNRRVLCCVSFAVLAVSFFPAQGSPDAPTDKSSPRYERIFDGRSFAGWNHDDPHWRVEAGAIVGEIAAGEQLRRNLFLFWEGELYDFDLRFEFRVSGHASANSGVQIRSQRVGKDGAAGYQADIDDGATWLGRIYDEHGRGLITERGTSVTISPNGRRTTQTFRGASAYRALVRRGEWNDYRVRAVGTRIEVFLNGERASILVDEETGALDLSGKLALQLHSGPGPAKIEFRAIELKQLGRSAPPQAGRSSTPPSEPRNRRPGTVPKDAEGEPLNLGFETGTLDGWTATGEAWTRQPVKGDTVAPRRPGQASDHDGEFWLGGYEFAGDDPTGVLESAAFEVTHPYASFLVGGGNHRETRVDLVAVESGDAIFSASGPQNENLELVVADLRAHVGKNIVVRVVDEHSGAWGHINYDDFRFHDELEGELRALGRPRRLRANPLLTHLQRNPIGSDPTSAAERTVANAYVPAGFRLDLVAAEPRVLQPIAFTFDARGRLWIAEAFTYPQRRPEGEGQDRISILADTDGDGSFDEKKVFLAGLNLVSGLELGHGGVWIGAAPQLLFVPDADEDDVPDGAAEVVLDGWGYQDTHETLNNFAWGPDGWLYGNQGVFNASRIGIPGTPEENRVLLYAGVWRYHPTRKTFEVFAHGGSNQWGLDFDEVGELFMTHCRSYWGGGPTTHVVLRGHYWNQANARHAPFVSGTHPAGLPHLRNFLRASARYGHGEGGAGKPGSRALYGGHSHVGTMVYLGDNWPEEYRGQLFTHNLHGHQINRQVNERRGAGYETTHAGTDILFVDDPQYVAVDLDYGPDGAVYIIDWYDRQHCHSPNTESWDRATGRIYRMSYASTYAPRSVDLRQLSDLELARLQDHRNAWYARTSRRLLHERSTRRAIERDAIAALRDGLKGDRATDVLRAAWTLHGIGALRTEDFARLLASPSDDVRAWFVRLATEDPGRAERQAASLLRLAESDPSARVRLAVASYIADAPTELAWKLAAALAARAEDAGDAYLPRMVWYGIAPHVDGDLERALGLAARTRWPQLRDFVVWHAAKTETGLARLLEGLARSPSADAERRTLELVLFARRGLSPSRAPEAWAKVAGKLYAHSDPAIRDRAERVGALLSDENVLSKLRKALSVESERRGAFEVLASVADAKSVPAFLKLLDVPELRAGVLRLLARFGAAEIPGAILERFARLDDRERALALGTLIVRAPSARLLLEAVVAGRIDKKHLNSFHVRQLRNLRDGEVNTLIAKLWGTVRDTSGDVSSRLARYAKLFTEAPLWAYDGGAGKKTFDELCATCHSPNAAAAVAGNTTATPLGPDLRGSGRNGAAYFLESVLDPNAVVGEDFQLTVITTDDGSVLSGLVLAETEESVTLRTLTETVVLKAEEIAAREKEMSSFMPEGLVDDLSERELIELLKYLSSL